MWVSKFNEIMRESNLTVVHVSQIMDVSEAYIYNLMSGKKKPPASNKIIVLIQYLSQNSCVPDYLIQAFLVATIAVKKKDKQIDELEACLESIQPDLHKKYYYNRTPNSPYDKEIMRLAKQLSSKQKEMIITQLKAWL